MRTDRQIRIHSWLARAGVLVVLTVTALAILVPFAWVFRGAFAPTDAEIYRLPPTPLIDGATLENFRRALTDVPFLRFFLNSLIVATSVTAIQLVTCSTAAYAFARLRFPGKRGMFAVVLGSLMIPAPITVVPLFIILTRVHLTDTLWALILPGIISGFGIFLLRQHFLSVPLEIEEAAKIDGAGPLRTFATIVLPLSGPALATLGILTFTYVWNELLLPLIMIRSTSNQTLPVGLIFLLGQYATGGTGATIAAIAMMVAPVLVVFLFLQRWIVQSIASSGLKL